MYSGNLLITHASGPSYPLDGGGSFGLVRSYNSLRVRRDRVRYENQGGSHVFRVLLSGRSWVGFGWTMHLGRVFRRAKHNSVSAEVFDNLGRDMFFVDAQGTEHDLRNQRETHPLLQWQHQAEQGHWDPACEGAPECPPYCGTSTRGDYPACDECGCAWFVDTPSQYVVTLENGTTYWLEKIVTDDVPKGSKGWIRNHDRNGWYATRIEDVHHNGVEIQYARSGPYPEAITRIRSIHDTAMEITTTLWTAADSNHDDLLLDGSGNKIWSPTFVGMLKEIHATGFKGTHGAPQDVMYKFVYGKVSEQDDGVTVDVPVLAKVILPEPPGSASGTIEYEYRGGELGGARDPGFGALLDRVLYPLGGVSSYLYEKWVCGMTIPNADVNAGVPRECLGVAERILYPDGLGASGDGAGQSRSVWRWERAFRLDPNESSPLCDESTPVINRFREIGPDGLVTESTFHGHPCPVVEDVDPCKSTAPVGLLKTRTIFASDGLTPSRSEVHKYDYTCFSDLAESYAIAPMESEVETTFHHEGATCFESSSSWPKKIAENNYQRTGWNEWRVSVIDGPATGNSLLSRRRLTYVHYDDAPGSSVPAPDCRATAHILSRAAFAFVEEGTASDGRRYEVQLAHSGDSGTAGCTGQMTQLRALQAWQAAGFAPTGTASPGPTSDRDLVSDLGYSGRGNLETANYSGGDLRVGGGRAAYTVNYTWNLGRAVTARISPLSYDSQSIAADVGGQIASSTDPNGFVTRYDFDPLGRLTKIDPPGSDEYATRVVYPSLTKTRVIRSPGTETDYQAADSQQEFSEETYDGLGRVVQRRRAMPQPNEVAIQVIRYDTRGREIFVSEWMKESEYAAATKVTWPWDNDGTGDNGYSVSGIPLVGGTGSRPRGTLNFYGVPNGAGTNPLDVTPDPLGRARRIELADGAVTAKQYCGPHEQTRVYGVDANGDGTASATEYVTTRLYRDGLGRLAMVDTDAEAPDGVGDGADAVYRYDPRGKLEKVTLVSQLPSDPFGSWVNPSWAPAGQTRTFEHDALGRLRQSFNPEKGHESFASYDVWGNLLAWQDEKGMAEGYFLENEHDEAGRLIQTGEHPGSPGAPGTAACMHVLPPNDNQTFDGSLGEWQEGTLDATGNFVTGATAWERVALGGCLPAPPSGGGTGALHLGAGCNGYASAQNRWEVVRLAVTGVKRHDLLSFKIWRHVRENSAGGGRDALEVWVTPQSASPQYSGRRVLYRLDEQQASFTEWLRSPVIRPADQFSEAEWPDSKSIYLWFAFNKGDSADPGLGKGIMIDDVEITRGTCGPIAKMVWDHDACAGGSFQAGEACTGGEEPANACLGRVSRVLSYGEDGGLLAERRFVYKGMNGRQSGTRQLLDWKGLASPGVDSDWASFVWRTGWAADGGPASLTAPYRGSSEVRSYSYQRSRGSLLGVNDVSRGQSFLKALGVHAPIEYNAAGQPTWIGYANGSSLAVPRDVLHRPQGMTVSALVAGGSVAPWQSGPYAFDGAGNITEIGGQRFTYDAVFRLKGARILPQAQAPAVTTPDVLSWTYDLAGNMLTQALVSTTQVPEPPGHDFAHTFPPALQNNDNRMTDAAFSYDPNGNLVRFRGQQQQAVGAVWDTGNRMRAFVEGDPWSSAGVPGEWYRYDSGGQRWFRVGRDGKPVLTLRDGEGQALAEFVESPTSGGPALASDFVYGPGKLLVERKVGVAPPSLAADSPLSGGAGYRFVVTSGAGTGAYTVDVTASSGYRNRIPGVTLDGQGKFTLAESALSPGETNWVRIRKDGATGSGFSAPVSLVYDPSVMPSSPNPVRALSIHWTATSLVVRWSLAQDTGVTQRLSFRSGDGQTTVLLTPVALPSSVVSYTLASQALSVPCGSLYLETAAGAASPAPGLPSSVAGDQGAGRDPCAGDPPAPDAPSGPYFVNWYHHRDHLGTLRNVTDEAGYVKIGYDDYPYGARMPQSATSPAGASTRQFTGHERDAATGLDYMGARYYGSAVSRFLSVDRGDAQTQEPRSWNRYSYVMGSPLRFRDPFGRDLFEDASFSARLRSDREFRVAWYVYQRTEQGADMLQKMRDDETTRYYLRVGRAAEVRAGLDERPDNGMTIPCAPGKFCSQDTFTDKELRDGRYDAPEISVIVNADVIRVQNGSLLPELAGWYLIQMYLSAMFEESTHALDGGQGTVTPEEWEARMQAVDNKLTPGWKEFFIVLGETMKDWLAINLPPDPDR